MKGGSWMLIRPGGSQPWQHIASLGEGSLKHEHARALSQIFWFYWSGVEMRWGFKNPQEPLMCCWGSEPLNPFKPSGTFRLQSFKFRWFTLWLQQKYPNPSACSQPAQRPLSFRDLCPTSLLGCCPSQFSISQCVLGSVLAQGTGLSHQEFICRQEIQPHVQAKIIQSLFCFAK